MAGLNVLHFGLGPIGMRIARLVEERPGLASVGAVDVDPQKTGRDLGELLGLGRHLNVPVVASLKETAPSAEIALHSTGSSLERVKDQLRLLIEAGLNVVSTCEELSFPWHHQPGLAGELDDCARANGVRLLGTGVNPGYVMDALPLVLTLPCLTATTIRIRRVVDTARRRVQLQRKTGAGLAVEEFRRLAGDQIRHVGLPESLAMVAAGVGWKIGEIDDRIEPIVADRERRSAEIVVPAGRVAGVHQVTRAKTTDGNTVELELIMAIQAEDEADSVEIDGRPPVRMVIPGGLHGDDATAAVVVNAVPRLLSTAPGLRTMLDLPLPRGVWGQDDT